MLEPQMDNEKLLNYIIKLQEGVERFIGQMGSQLPIEVRMFQAGMFVRFCNEYLISMEKIVRKDVKSPPST